MAYYENIEKLFNDDVREKKRTGRGAFSMRGKGVKHGFNSALKTPYHFMTTRERNKLNGSVEVSNMYETIIPIEEFRLKDEETQRNMLIRWREIYDNGSIKKGLGIPNSPYYKLVEELKVPTKPRGGSVSKGKRKAKATAVAPEKEKQGLLEFELTESVTPETKKEIEKEVVKQMLVTKGLHLEYNGSYDVDALNKLFTKLQLVIDGDTNKYNISLSLTEIVED